MADAGLHGNGVSCPACELRRAEQDTRAVLRAPVPCNACGGTGRGAIADVEIVESSAEWARAHYWPEFDRRNGL